MDILEKINKLREEKGWSMYKLAYESMLTQSTLANMFYRKTQPSIETLKSICNAFNISLSEFFAEDDTAIQTTKEKELLINYRRLSKKNQEAVFELVKKIK